MISVLCWKYCNGDPIRAFGDKGKYYDYVQKMEEFKKAFTGEGAPEMRLEG